MIELPGILPFAAVFMASLTQGLTGFGFALVAVPLLLLFHPPGEAVPIVILHSLIVNMFILVNVRTHVNLKRIWPLMAAGLAGVPLGGWLLAHLDMGIMKTGIGVLTVVFALLMLFNVRKKVEKERHAFVPVGLASGILQGSISIGGPPVILFLSNQEVHRFEFRANLVAYFTCLGLLNVPVHCSSGLLNGPVALKAAMMLPALGLGAWCGMALSARLPEEAFRRIVLAVVIGSGLVVVGSGAGIS